MQASSSILPMLLAALVSAITAVVAWRRRTAPGALALVGLMVSVCGWTICYSVQTTLVEFRFQAIAAKSSFLFNLWIPTLFLMFVLQYTSRERWLSRHWRWLLVEPYLTLVLVWSSIWHGLYHTYAGQQLHEGAIILNEIPGPWHLPHFVYSYSLMALAVGLLLRSLIRAPGLYRGQAAITIAAALAPWILNALTFVGFRPFARIDPTPLGFTISGVLLVYALLRYRLFDIVPVARDVVVQSMDDAVIVLDGRGRIVDLNPAALELIALPAAALIGQPAAQVFARWSDLVARFAGVPEARTEIVFEAAGVPRYLDLRLSPLHDQQGRRQGRLVVLRDITDRVQASSELQKANEAIELQNKLLRAGLSLARETQLGLLPARPPWPPSQGQVWCRSQPALEVGGDFYTFATIGPGAVGLAVGDISGKGVAAALMMALASSIVEEQSGQHADPGACLAAINQRLHERLAATGMQLALVCVVLDLERCELRVANAGMIWPILISDGAVEFIEVGGFTLGAGPDLAYPVRTVSLAPGAVLVLVSDGVVEARNPPANGSPAGELFGFERLEALLRTNIPAAALADQILAAVAEFMGPTPPHDDITVVVVACP